MSQQRSITVKQLYGGKVWEIRGCTHPHKDLLLSLSCEWEAKKLRWLYHGKTLPTPLQQLADGTYGLESLKTGVLHVEPVLTPKTLEKPIAPKREQTEPQNSDVPKAIEWQLAKKITIVTSQGDNRIDADVFGTVAIHKPFGAETGWTITHLESGMVIAYFPYDWLKAERLRPLAEKLNTIDITQFWEDKNSGVNNLAIAKEIKAAVQDFDSLVKVAMEVRESDDEPQRKFQMGDRVKAQYGRIGGIVQGYNAQRVIVQFPLAGNKTETFETDEDKLLPDDVTVYLDQLKEGSKVIWMATSSKGYNEIVPVKATVHKINPKTIQIEVEEKVEGDTWITVKRTVKMEHLRWPKTEA